MMKKLVFYSFVSLLFAYTSAKAQIPAMDFVATKQWVGPYDIRMVGSANLQGVFIDPTEASAGRLRALSVIPHKTIVMMGSDINVNNDYTGFGKSVNIAKPALLCPDVNTPCYDGYTMSSNSTCTTGRYNSSPDNETRVIAMTYADYDSDPNTFSSSMAQLPISNCSQIESAFLYWVGTYSESPAITLVPTNSNIDGSKTSFTGNGASVFNVTSSSGYDKVLFKVPGSTTYQQVTASIKRNDNQNANNDQNGAGAYYLCAADVTNQVKAGAGTGQYWVGNLQSYPTRTSGGSCSGWALIVVYSSPLSPPRTISLWNGLKNLEGSTMTFNLGGFTSPNTTNVTSYLGFGSLDGDDQAADIKGSATAANAIDFRTGNAPYQYINPMCENPALAYKAWSKGEPAGSWRLSSPRLWYKLGSSV
jgi:hypothetical protein